MKTAIYMDHNATTPLDPRVRDSLMPYLTEHFGNAGSSTHAFGWQAQKAVRLAREQVAGFLGCRANDVLWTSGATESNNLAILGLARAWRGERPHFITQATEHKAVLEVFDAATEFGAEITVLPVDDCGRVRMEELERAVKSNTALISIMMANNEVGALQPVEAIARLCRDRKIVFHCDAAQAAGKIPIALGQMPIDLLSLSGHKIYGPKGVGALIQRPVNRDFTLKPILFGGDQEQGLRPGTLNVAGIVGFGTACAIAASDLAEERTRTRVFLGRLWEAVRPHGVKLNGPSVEDRLCNNLSLSFASRGADDLALGLSGVAYSSGSACNSLSAKPSHVLTAMGVESGLAKATVRLSPGRFTTAAEVDQVCAKLSKLLEV